MNHSQRDYFGIANDVTEAAKVWAGISPLDLNIDFDNIEKIRKEELLDTNMVILSCKEAQGNTGPYYTCLCVTEHNQDDIFIFSTGSAALVRKLKVASSKKQIPMKGKLVLCRGKKNQEYFDLVECDYRKQKNAKKEDDYRKQKNAKKEDDKKASKNVLKSE